jgi:hypothetical protein
VIICPWHRKPLLILRHFFSFCTFCVLQQTHAVKRKFLGGLFLICSAYAIILSYRIMPSDGKCLHIIPSYFRPNKHNYNKNDGESVVARYKWDCFVVIDLFELWKSIENTINSWGNAEHNDNNNNNVLIVTDVEKLSKMKKLLEILSNPSKRMPLETLLKCEVVLEKLDFKRVSVCVCARVRTSVQGFQKFPRKLL